MNKEKVLVVAPTTASRLPLLKEVLGKLYLNSNLDIKTIVVKNGTYSNDEYEKFDFGFENVIKNLKLWVIFLITYECRVRLYN